MPLRTLTAADAFRTLKSNPYGHWPRIDDPENRFASYADPAFETSFRLEPGQRIFTIGSCFARSIERALAARGFDIPMLDFTVDPQEWGGDPGAVLNTYVPSVIAPQIRWAFGLEKFDLGRHCAEVRPERYVDLQLTSGFRPMPAETVLARRERINALYRKLADSHVVLLTLGLIEAWFDRKSSTHINAAPPKSAALAEPDRFELQVLTYEEVLASLRGLTALFDQVCPPGYRMILTVSPVPLTATFTPNDVAVANAYSKAVLRAAAEALVAEQSHIEYFPSYESVMLTARDLAFAEDQIHIRPQIVRFNVDRMIRRYVGHEGVETSAQIVARAREERRAQRPGLALKLLQSSWADRPGDGEIVVALADELIRHRQEAAAEKLLTDHVAAHDSGQAHLLLARLCNDQKRHDEAAIHAERASELNAPRLQAGLQRAIAYYHLGRLEEGLAVLERLQFVLDHKPLILFWKAKFAARLGRIDEAEELFRQCNGLAEETSYMVGFAEFLADQERRQEARHWVDSALALKPFDQTALRLRRTVSGPRVQTVRASGTISLATKAVWLWQALTGRFRAGSP